MNSIPVTIITGFLGSGKTTLIINLLPQLLTKNPNYKLALIKNEFGDLAIDSQLAAATSISGVREILNGCIESIAPDRIVIETSGSAFPATLAMEVNRLGRETGGKYILDGVVNVIDVENWKGYEDTSFTARLQARYTDLIIFNKWEEVDERRWDECLDHLGDIEVETPWVKSRRGWVDINIIFGLDVALTKNWEEYSEESKQPHKNTHGKDENHQNEVEVLSVTLSTSSPVRPGSSDSKSSFSSNLSPKIDTQTLLEFLKRAPRDEIYRIKAIFTSSTAIPSSESSINSLHSSSGSAKYILNWSFSRWTCTPLNLKESSNEGDKVEHPSSVAVGQGEVFLRMVIILARDAAEKWKTKLEGGNLIRFDGVFPTGVKEKLEVVSIS